MSDGPLGNPNQFQCVWCGGIVTGPLPVKCDGCGVTLDRKVDQPVTIYDLAGIAHDKGFKLDFTLEFRDGGEG